MTRAIAGIAIACVLFFYVGLNGGLAQRAGHHHPPKDSELHDRFYSTWMRPDNRAISCCNKIDCYPTAARMTEFGTWQAQRREDGKWLNVPPATVETERDNPDGRAHLCAPPPDREAAYRNGVICFIAGAGI
jgi:hypothetical protein